ncbi:D-alanyl-D-alanine carboxypeptidase/D-alanyl-D-alanine-endopeptidase [Siphonobacter sp. SORGH_AS_0500]|uniref:D-alanyl-D-alanine carboxypeptidase/D-alanyl-D-alanine endopeptidase n=1 Tax=Siphonobacter sp. SORGH_AS_0500 TaxID=1864824 RepID=UPI00285E4989|nr:D-alanyl-D-alanine carboxypeptidase/D-alanyl-D-alanine-endopeptidase [Siphonobacter sp. SORGH_AS_0500]MDR6195472.1 D-alanyl-D-alanine carboxypeptidase/D-alanyl-D-alanine-endopeptidase (penicillin-binding protein 4) [Siphonobacter sp. SORGH_AS_0500]
MNRIYFLIISVFFASSSFAQNIDTLAQEALIRRLDSLQNSFFMQHGSVSACIKSVKTGQTVLAFHHRKSVPPASTMKLITTATALAVLNQSFTYTTTLETDGVIRNDTLFGNLWIRGSGDPSLGGGRFKSTPTLPTLLKSWATALRDKKIRHMTGRVIGDGSVFDENSIPGGWPWEDLGNYYGAGVSGLNMNENKFRAVFKPGTELDDPAGLIRTEPALPGYTLINRVKTDGPRSGDQVTIYSTPLGSQYFLEGYVPQGPAEFGVQGSLANPSLFTATALQQVLLENGITVGDTSQTSFDFLRRNQALAFRDTLAKVQSPTLKDLATECNFQSINLYAEAFLKTIGVALNYGNTTQDGVKALEKIWTSKRVSLAGFRIKDGSGLSPQSVLTLDTMTDILAVAARESYFPAFYSTIAVLGKNGTVKNMGRGTKAAGNVRAKSGSIGGTRAFAGYFNGKNGQLYAFAFNIQQYDLNFGSSTRELEKLMVMMVNL